MPLGQAVSRGAQDPVCLTQGAVIMEEEAGIRDLGALECIAIEDSHGAGRNRTKKSNFHLKDQLHS